MKKVIKTLCMTVALLCVLTFCTTSVFAADQTTQMHFEDSQIYDSKTSAWIDSTAWSSWDASTGYFKVLRNSIPEATNYIFSGLRTKFSVNGTVQAPVGYYLNFSCYFSDQYFSGIEDISSYNFKVILTLRNSETLELVPYSVSSSVDSDGLNTWRCDFAAKVADDYGGRINLVEFETDMPSYGTNTAGSNSYSAVMRFSFSQEMTEEMKQHQELIAEIGNAADQVTDKIDESTDTITNGWSTDDDSAGTIGGVTDDLGSAESDALGGKTDEEIQAEVDTALSGEGLPETNGEGVLKVGMTFDNLLSAFGADYQALLVLALTLGLASLLVGHSYRARGD